MNAIQNIKSIFIIYLLMGVISLMVCKENYIYTISFTRNNPNLEAEWESSDWKDIAIVKISNFRHESSDHRPETSAKLQFNKNGIFGIFFVKDKYVKCVHQDLQDPVYKDSCVEFFVQPGQNNAYFNFEFNCGGCASCSYITYQYNSNGTLSNLEKNKLKIEDLKLVEITHTLPELIEDEIAEPIEWRLGFFIPFSLMEKYVGSIENFMDQEWKGNFYKCGSGTSHPHWASWSPVDEKNFHLPHCFGTLKFEFASQ